MTELYSVKANFYAVPSSPVLIRNEIMAFWHSWTKNLNKLKIHPPTNEK